MKSLFLKLAASDLVKSAIMAGLTAIGTLLLPILNSGSFPDLAQLQAALINGVSVAGIYLLKNLLTNSDDKFLAKEVKKSQDVS